MLLPVMGVAQLSGIASISMGISHTCALSTSGGVKCWGYNNIGQLGDGSTTSRYTPVNVSGLSTGLQAIALGESHTCALTTAGGVKCWGNNSYGQLGDGSTTNRYTPVDTNSLSSGIQAISPGYQHSCALTTSGGVKCWGRNYEGQLGDGSTTNRYTPVDTSSLSSGIQAISLGRFHSCALITSGGVKCWGRNEYGQLGDGSTTSRYTPVDTSGLSSGIQVISLRNFHSCALTTSGGVKCWGCNGEGRLGDGSTTNRYTPVDTNSLSSGIQAISPGYQHSCALTTSGGVKCWGYNAFGQLGDGSTTNRYTPVDTNSLSSGIQVISMDGYHSCALTSSGGVKCWGNNASGQLGDGSTTNMSTAVDVILSTHTMSGTITAGGSPLSGVTVSGGALGDTTTDMGGAYSFTGVTYDTSYTITPTLTDYDFTPTSSSGTVTGDVTQDFTAVYNPATTTSTSSVATTTTVPTTTEPTTTVEPSSTTVEVTSTALTTSSTVEATTTVPTTTMEPTTTVETTTTEITTTVAITSVPVTSTVETTSTIEITTTVSSSTTIATTTALTTTTMPITTTVPEDSDGDGVTDSEEVATGTNPNDPGSFAPELGTTLCSDYLDGMHNIMEHVNLTRKRLKVRTQLRSLTGWIKDTYDFSLLGNQQFGLSVHSRSGRGSNSYGQVCSTYTGAAEGSLDGQMVYYKFGKNGDIQFAFALPFENPVRGSSGVLFNTYQPSLDPNDAGNLITNWVQLSNASKKALKGKLSFFDLNGRQLRALSVNLNSGARRDYSAHSYGANEAGLVRFVPTDTRQDYQLREIRYLYDNAGATDSFASALPLRSRIGSGQTLIAPVDTSSGTATLELANMLSKPIRVDLKIYYQTDKKLLYRKTLRLNKYQTEHLSLTTILSNNQGLVVAKASEIGSLTGTVIHYGLKSTGGLQSMYAIDLREPISKTTQGSYNTYLNQGCTLYLANLASFSQKVRISMQQSNGTSPVRDYTLTVPGHGVTPEDLCAKSPKNVYGVVTVTASNPKRIYGVVVRKGEGERYKMATPMR